MHKDLFLLTRDVVIKTEMENEPIRRAVSRFYRDLEMVLDPEDKNMRKNSNGTLFLKKGVLPAEEYHILVESNEKVTITASEELGFIYALLYISEHCLGILPFWFWKKPVAYRGWFINDEVLISF